MPSIYRRIYIRYINDELKKEEEAHKKRNKKNQPTNEELLQKLEEGAKLDSENKTGLNLNQFIDKMKSKQSNKDKVEAFYEKNN